jgi:precorrin-6B methylase 2
MNALDWNSLWQAQLRQATRYDMVEDPGAFWDKRAQRFQQMACREERILPILKYLKVPEGAGILDIGAGTGGLAIPFARRGHDITAIEPSAVMLDCLTENAASAAVSHRIRSIRKRWEEVIVGRDIEPQDLVIAANSLGVQDLLPAVEKIIRSARKSVCILMFAGPAPHTPADLWPLIFGQPYHPFPDYMTVVNLLYTLGIYANISVWTDQGDRKFNDIEAAIAYYREILDPFPDSRESVLRHYLEGRLEKTDNGLLLRQQWQTAMIHWQIRS